MPSLPNGWTETTLGAQLDLLRNGTTATQVKRETPFPVSRIETIADQTIDWSRVGYLASAEERYLIQPGDILYSHINSVAHMGKVALYDGGRPLYHGMNLMLLRPTPSHVEPRYLYLVLTSERGRRHARRECKSAINQASLSQGDITRLAFSLPPLPEQRRIAEILDTVDDAIRKTEEIIAKLKQVKQGLLHDLLTRGIDDNGELRDLDRHPEQFKDSRLGRIPKAWEVRPTPSLFTQVRPGTRQDARSCAFGGPIPVLDQSTDDFMGYFQGPAGVRASEQEPVVAFANHTCAVRWITYDCSAIQNVFFMRPVSDVSARFLFYSIDGKIPQTAYQGHWPLLQESLATVPPLREQRRIEASLCALDQRCSHEVGWLSKLRLLRQGLMEDLLTGQVRVTSLLEEAAE